MFPEAVRGAADGFGDRPRPGMIAGINFFMFREEVTRERPTIRIDTPTGRFFMQRRITPRCEISCRPRDNVGGMTNRQLIVPVARYAFSHEPKPVPVP